MRPAFTVLLAALLMPGADALADPDDPAYGTFLAGKRAYEAREYRAAADSFALACDQTLLFVDAYYLWLGAACEEAYDATSEPAKPESVFLLKRGMDAYRKALDRNRSPAIRFDMGRLMVRYGLEQVRAVLRPATVESPAFVPTEAQDTSAAPGAGVGGSRTGAPDSLGRFWEVASQGLTQVWAATLDQEYRERIQYAAAGGGSDTLEAYLSLYVEDCVRLVETAARVGFEGIEPDFYIPKIAAACKRGASGSNPAWFEGVLNAVRFDGGHNLRSAIYRMQGLRLNGNGEREAALDAFRKAVFFARSDTSRASLYLDMAFAAYSTDLARAVDFARTAYELNPQESRIRDTYGGLALSLANRELKKGRHQEALAVLHPVTVVAWEDQAEALMSLARTYLQSDTEGVLDRAYKAGEAAYRLDPEHYWEEFRMIAERCGSFAQAIHLRQLHVNGDRHGR